MALTVAYPTREPKGEQFKKHIKDTSGVKDIEVLEYVNPDGRSLTEIYNQALSEASNDIVVLQHDDIFYNKSGWGQKLLKQFKNSDYGILGVAGTTHIPASGKWWEDPTKMVGVVKHSHVDEEGKKHTWESKYSNNFADRIIEVAMLDGVFLAVHRQRIEEKFDEEIKGVHFYDIDFTLKNHLKGVKVGVSFQVKLTHESIGQTDDKWEENRKQFVEKYSFHPVTNEPLLPYHIEPELIYEDKEVEVPEKNQPKILIVTPSGADKETVKKCVTSIKNVSSYKNYKMVVANTTNEDRNEELAEHVDNDERFEFIDEEYTDYASLNNKLVREWADEDTELVLFSDDDIELINDAISRMVKVYNNDKKKCGTIGARTHLEDGKVEHSGISLMLTNQGTITITNYGKDSYYNYRDNVTKDIFGNSSAFMLINKKLFDQVGGFNLSYGEHMDAQLNIEAIKEGKTNILVGNAACYHYKSQTRSQTNNFDEVEGSDKMILNSIINNPSTWGYFLNIKRKDFEALVMQSIKQQQEQQQQEQE